ncbi:hypothetical protein GCM10019059_07530 [Camelimonas fluminis]|uniref:Uncharacterized protein n=1 Tax=Camelimonas fluminis TaxID=1576911 RepID=A0ABV7UED2_9HYPH|nr:hypothetical protein [Camelimonas fluminis]GHE50896.1 hypothetical protein GCM10019059_07530 [Camelimonas fluminis]
MTTTPETSIVEPTDGSLDDDRIIPLLLAQAASRGARYWDYQDAHQVYAALLAKLDAALPARAPEPAAARWEIRSPAGCPSVTDKADLAGQWLKQGYVVTPFYTAPPNPVAASAVDGQAATGDWHMEAVYEVIEELHQAAKQAGTEPMKALLSDAADMAIWLISAPSSPAPVADNPAGDPVVNAPMSLWAAAAMSMLATYDAFMDGALQSPADRASFEHLLLAASFGAQAFDDAPPIARGGAEVSLLLKAFCQALIDPSDKRLDHLRANYAPPSAAEPA